MTEHGNEPAAPGAAPETEQELEAGAGPAQDVAGAADGGVRHEGAEETAPEGDAGSRWRTVEIDGREFRQIEFEHEDVERKIVGEIESGVDVYYNRRWDLTRRFCEFLLSRPELVEGLRVLVAGAGVGLEAVVVGKRAAAVTVNDVAPVALELQKEQLLENGIRDPKVARGPFQEASLEGVDLVVACYVVYDDATREAMNTLLDRTRERGIPVLLANEDLEGQFTRLLEETDRRVQELQADEGTHIVWVS